MSMLTWAVVTPFVTCMTVPGIMLRALNFIKASPRLVAVRVFLLKGLLLLVSERRSSQYHLHCVRLVCPDEAPVKRDLLEHS
jgi:hypothetical protein